MFSSEVPCTARLNIALGELCFKRSSNQLLLREAGGVSLNGPIWLPGFQLNTITAVRAEGIWGAKQRGNEPIKSQRRQRVRMIFDTSRADPIGPS